MAIMDGMPTGPAGRYQMPVRQAGFSPYASSRMTGIDNYRDANPQQPITGGPYQKFDYLAAPAAGGGTPQLPGDYLNGPGYPTDGPGGVNTGGGINDGYDGLGAAAPGDFSNWMDSYGQYGLGALGAAIGIPGLGKVGNAVAGYFGGDPYGGYYGADDYGGYSVNADYGSPANPSGYL